MEDFIKITLSTLTGLSSKIRMQGESSESMEEAAEKIVRFVFENLKGENESCSSSILVRLFRTCSHAELTPTLQQHANQMASKYDIKPDTKCLTMLATAGIEEQWNHRTQSVSHQVIPLISVETVKKFPMISQLIDQLGLDLHSVVRPDKDIILSLEENSYNILYVPKALGCDLIPAQKEFVIPYGVKAVIGLGGLFPNGDIFTLIIFSRHSISIDSAIMLKPLALNIKIALLPFIFGSNKMPLDSAALSNKATDFIKEKESMILSILQLLEVHEKTVFDQSIRVESVAEELALKNRDLESINRELKETQSKVVHQEKMASIGQLAAGVAHEINNPIGFISSNLTSLETYFKDLKEYLDCIETMMRSLKEVGEKDTLKKKRDELDIEYLMNDIPVLLNESKEGIETVKSIVKNLRNFSRIDTDASYEYFNINDCLESTIRMVWNELKYKCEVKKEYGSIPNTMCYPMQLNQVFMNLLVNASHSIKENGTIHIKTYHKNEFILIEIEDNGAGIEKKNIHKIFEPFFTTKDVGKGTGLGLSITYDIIKNHNGEITVHSELGKGTIFSIRIPVIENKVD